MEAFIGGAMMMETALLSFLLALWISWLGMRGLFRLMPAKSRSAAPIRFAADRQAGSRSRHAA
jgi:hypothetical protein